MRPIRYRCFNKKTNNMEYNIYIINLSHNEVVIWKEIYDDGQSYVNYETLFSSKDEFELMQFTGLHDRNGKAIYEGDIVKFSDGQYVDSGYTYEIVFHEGSVRCKSENKYFYDHRAFDKDGWDKFYSPEIIGNIHENPELLETK